MPHILIAGAIHEDGLRLIDETPGYSYDYVPSMAAGDYLPYLAGAEALVIRTQPVTAAALALAPKLKIISRHGVGIDSVDVEAVTGLGLPLMVTGDTGARSVAEHALAALMMLTKQMPQADAALRAGDWDWKHRLLSRDFAGRRLLLIGYGRIARLLAELAAPFGFEIHAYSPSLTDWPDGPARPAPDLAKALASADLVSIHAPWRGKALLGAAELALLPKGALLVNTSRGGVVDETALAEALTSGHLGGAAIDVFRDEPPLPDNPLLSAPNLMLSPHIAGVTEDAARRLALTSIQNVFDHFAGRPDPGLIVNGIRP